MISLKQKINNKLFPVQVKTLKVGGDVYIFENKTYPTIRTLGEAIAKKANRLKGECAIGYTESFESELASKINSAFSVFCK